MNKLTKKFGDTYTPSDNLQCGENSYEFKSLLINSLGKYEHFNTLRPISEWHEDYGDCLFWNIESWKVIFGNPLSSDWKDNYYTHFTRIMSPIIEGGIDYATKN